MDTTTIRRTPARDPACCRFPAAVVKNSVAAACSGDGPVAVSMTLSTPSSAAARPSPVITSTPFERDMATTSCPPSLSTSTTCRPTRPVAPATAILAMSISLRVCLAHCHDGSRPPECDMLFQLRRLDVWPVGDLGVRRGYGLAWQVPEPTARELGPLGEVFRPYRSVAAWYCWRAAELYAGAADSALTRLSGLARPGGAMMVSCRSSRWTRRPVSY